MCIDTNGASKGSKLIQTKCDPKQDDQNFQCDLAVRSIKRRRADQCWTVGELNGKICVVWKTYICESPVVVSEFVWPFLYLGSLLFFRTFLLPCEFVICVWSLRVWSPLFCYTVMLYNLVKRVDEFTTRNISIQVGTLFLKKCTVGNYIICTLS